MPNKTVSKLSTFFSWVSPGKYWLTLSLNGFRYQSSSLCGMLALFGLLATLSLIVFEFIDIFNLTNYNST